MQFKFISLNNSPKNTWNCPFLRELFILMKDVLLIMIFFLGSSGRSSSWRLQVWFWCVFTGCLCVWTTTKAHEEDDRRRRNVRGSILHTRVSTLFFLVRIPVHYFFNIYFLPSNNMHTQASAIFNYGEALRRNSGFSLFQSIGALSVSSSAVACACARVLIEFRFFFSLLSHSRRVVKLLQLVFSLLNLGFDSGILLFFFLLPSSSRVA